MGTVEQLHARVSEAEAEAKRIREYKSAAGFAFQDWVITEAERRVQVARDALALAQQGPPPKPRRKPRRKLTVEDYEARIDRAEDWLDTTNQELAAWYESHYTEGVDFNYPSQRQMKLKARLENRARDLETKIALNRARIKKLEGKK